MAHRPLGMVHPLPLSHSMACLPSHSSSRAMVAPLPRTPTVHPLLSPATVPLRPTHMGSHHRATVLPTPHLHLLQMPGAPPPSPHRPPPVCCLRLRPSSPQLHQRTTTHLPPSSLCRSTQHRVVALGLRSLRSVVRPATRPLQHMPVRLRPLARRPSILLVARLPPLLLSPRRRAPRCRRHSSQQTQTRLVGRPTRGARPHLQQRPQQTRLAAPPPATARLRQALCPAQTRLHPRLQRHLPTHSVRAPRAGPRPRRAARSGARRQQRRRRRPTRWETWVTCLASQHPHPHLRCATCAPSKPWYGRQGGCAG
mmetsp:Transcript_9632/g.23894  ORF Transcript_9632/g.23894 Transcript_9632/m.23894 type:complete len:311 (+) Transcript_9632:1641-2573(+)